jgi:hypothetical protein
MNRRIRESKTVSSFLAVRTCGIAVAHTERVDRICIMSARRASRKERRDYEETSSKSTERGMRDEYDFSGGVRGKYARRYARGTNVVVLEPDVAKVFPSAEAANAPKIRPARFQLSPDHITEVDSKEHVLLQCVDLLLGAMAFRLNDLHKQKSEGQKIRGKRTRAKDRLYRHALGEIRTLKPAFKPKTKISTAAAPSPQGVWTMPYRHWLFEAKRAEFG